MKIKIIISSVIIFLIILALTAFSINKSKTIELELGLFSGSPFDVPDIQSYKIIDEAIKAFEKDYPNIKIKYQSGILKSDYSEWLSERVLKGKIPDVFVVPSTDFNNFSSVGLLKKLDKLILNDKTFDKTLMYENAMKIGEFSGEQYAIPMEIDPMLMFVNKSILEKEKIEIPSGDWTWDDFYNICAKVTKDKNGDGKIDQFGVVDFTWKNAVFSNGQVIFDKSGKTSYFDNPHVIESINFVRNINALNQNNPVSIDDFNEGRVVFKPFPFSWYRIYKSYPYRLIRYADFKWECISPPKGPFGKNASIIDSLMLGINAKTPHEKEAWMFLKYLCVNSETQMNVFTYSHGVPVLRTVTESKRADVELRKYNPEEKVSIDRVELGKVIEDSFVIPRFNKYDNAMNLADLAIYKIINENKEIRPELEKLNGEINSYLKSPE